MIKKEIRLEDIIDINFKKNLVINNEQKRNNSDNEFAAQMAAALIFGPMGSMAASSGLLDDINNYERVSFNSQFDIEINCKIDNEIKKIVFHSKNNPVEFVDYVKEIINSNKN